MKLRKKEKARPSVARGPDGLNHRCIFPTRHS